MKIQSCINLYKLHLLVGAIFVSIVALANAYPERYNVIISRAPFGLVAQEQSAPKTDSTELTPEQIQLQQELEKEAEALGKNIKLTAITFYKGVPAAGIIELNTKRTYYLTKGQSILGYTLTDIAENSILLETTNAIANITMSYAAGQPSEIIMHPTSGRLSVLNIFENTVAVTNSVSIKQPASDLENNTQPIKKTGELELSDEVRKAVTIKDPDGTERISFRELHRLRIEEQKQKLEKERLAREEKERLAREERDRIANEEREAKEAEISRNMELQSSLETEEYLAEESETSYANEGVEAIEYIEQTSDGEVLPIDGNGEEVVY